MNAKNTLRIASLMLLLSLFWNPIHAQDLKFGVTGGLLRGGIKMKADNMEITSSNTGFYVGVFSKVKLSENMRLSPELDYGNIDNNSNGHLSAKIDYYVIPKLYLQAGPQLTYLFGSYSDGSNKSGIDALIGAGYDITDHFHLQARYAFELTDRDRYKNNTDISVRLNWLFVGIGYTF